MKKSILVLMCIVMANLANAQESDSLTVKRIVDETLYNATAYSNLRLLCKSVGQRLSGSPQFLKAVTLVSKMMKDAGADTVYLQPCMIPHWVRGEKERGTLSAGTGKAYNMHLCALGTSIGTGPGGVTAEVIEVSSMAELDRLGTQNIKGKIVFFNFRMNPTYIQLFKAYGESGVSRVKGPAMAGKYGAVGAMVRSLAINFNNYPHTGVTRYNDSFPKVPAVAISTNDAEYLHKLLLKGKPVRAYFRTTCQNLAPVKGYNVVGEIRGYEFPGEIVTVGGHLDSWDLAEGANDDGSGVVQGIEVLRNLSTNFRHPKRTVRAVAFANEEIGGTGADAYLESVKLKHEKQIFALESDEGGFTPRGFSLDMNADQRAKVIKWKDLFYPYGVYSFENGGGGSDIGPLRVLGTAMAGLSPDSQRYFDIHHAATDVFENVSERELNLGAANMAALTWLVSEYGL